MEDADQREDTAPSPAQPRRVEERFEYYAGGDEPEHGERGAAGSGIHTRSHEEAGMDEGQSDGLSESEITWQSFMRLQRRYSEHPETRNSAAGISGEPYATYDASVEQANGPSVRSFSSSSSSASSSSSSSSSFSSSSSSSSSPPSPPPARPPFVGVSGVPGAPVSFYSLPYGNSLPPSAVAAAAVSLGAERQLVSAGTSPPPAPQLPKVRALSLLQRAMLAGKYRESELRHVAEDAFLEQRYQDLRKCDELFRSLQSSPGPQHFARNVICSSRAVCRSEADMWLKCVKETKGSTECNAHLKNLEVCTERMAQRIVRRALVEQFK